MEIKIPNWLKYILSKIYPDLKILLLVFWIFIFLFILFKNSFISYFPTLSVLDTFEIYTNIYFIIGIVLFIYLLVKRLILDIDRKILKYKRIKNTILLLGKGEKNTIFEMYKNNDYSLIMTTADPYAENLRIKGLVSRPGQYVQSFSRIRYFLTIETIQTIKKYNMFDKIDSEV